MRTFWFAVYNLIGVPLIWLFFNLYSLFNSTVREGLRERRDLFNLLNRSLSSFRDKKRKRIIIHSSSLGEYQQALPLVEELRNKNYNIILSFFSPSGYNNSNINYPEVIKTYIPLDSVYNVKKFLDLTDPEIIIFMRYDLWFNLLYEAKKRKIRTVLANSRYDELDRTWSIPVISSFRKTLYGMLDIIFAIDDQDEINYRKKLGRENVEIIRTGDSKFERVYQSAKKEFTEEFFPKEIIKDKKIFVIGSSWKDDEDVILPAVDKALLFNKDLLTMLVPHEPKETKLEAIERSIASSYGNIRTIRYSDIIRYKDENLIIIDRIGLLSKLYSLAYLSYVGGGFKTGLHNILEPAIFKMPIMFSNEVKNSDEDEILLKYGCGILISDSRHFYRYLRTFLDNKKLRDETGEKCSFVFKDSVGIAEKIVRRITAE